MTIMTKEERDIAFNMAIKALTSMPCGDTIGRQVILNAIHQQKTGRWLAKSSNELYCDNCGFDFDIMKNEFIDKMKYCPNCGAKMADIV